MNENIFILFHLSTGDNLTMYALIRYYQQIYNNIYIFSLYRNQLFVKQLYEYYPNIHVIVIEDINYNNYLVLNYILDEHVNKVGNYDIIKIGGHNEDWNNTDLRLFWRKFYENSNLPYEIRYDYNNINRNYENELKLYNLLISKYSNNYIFVHDHRHINYNHFHIRRNINLDTNIETPIFHPNFNYYTDNSGHIYYNLWSNDLISNNLLDYCMIIENAKEIYISDSSFACLCPYLNLSHIKKKCVYTRLNMVDYHNSFNDWEIIFD